MDQTRGHLTDSLGLKHLRYDGMLNPKPSGIRVEKLSTSIGVFLFILFLTPVLILNKERKSYVKSFRFSNKFSFKENP